MDVRSAHTQAILTAVADWALDELWPETPHLTLVSADGAEHVFAREGRFGPPMTVTVAWLFAKWEHALQFAARNRALAAQPAYTVTNEQVEDRVPEYVRESPWS